MNLISGPAIARLFVRTRKWANDATNRAAFGPVTARRGVHFVSLTAVERHAGRTFTQAHIELAADGVPDRVLNLQRKERAMAQAKRKPELDADTALAQARLEGSPTSMPRWPITTLPVTRPC
jgi:hypothetical protein